MGTPSDPSLSAAVARDAVAEHFPDVDASELERLGSGWDFDAFRTADGWAFRFPRHDHSESLVERDRPVLELVRPYLPEEVALPMVEDVAPPGAAFPRRFARHRYVAGVALDHLSVAVRPALAASLGRVLGAIHAVPVDEARAAGLDEVVQPEEHVRAWFEGGLRGLAACAGQDPAIDRALDWVRSEPDPTRRLAAPLRFVHQDLSTEHVLADPETGRVTGILDWSDARLGDAARDFVILVAFGGWDFTEAALAAYPRVLDRGFRERLRFMSRLLPAMWLGWAQTKGEDVSRHLEWLRNAWADASGTP